MPPVQELKDESSSNDWQPWGVPLIVIAVLVVLVIFILLLRKWIRGPMYKGTSHMGGKTVVITGGNTGIGKITAMDLARRGANVVILCRNEAKAKTAIEEIRKETDCDVKYVNCDLASLKSIRECAAQLNQMHPKINVLINNAGVMMCPQMDTEDHFEMQFGTNHLGHFLLTYLLMDRLKAGAPSRVVNVSSLMHATPGTRIHWSDVNLKNNYNSVVAYSQSKLANILFTRSLATKYKDDGITSYALHPGVIKTELNRHLEENYGTLYTILYKGCVQHFVKDPTLGAQTSIYCAVDDALADQSGLYYSDCKRTWTTPAARNDEDAERLWKLSMDMVGLHQ